MSYSYATRVAPGCHGGPDRLGGICSRHRTMAAAVRAARKCDRLVVVAYEDGVALDTVLYIPPARGLPDGRTGRYGRGA